MHLAFLNAEALAADAARLLPTSPARALSLAVLALEELGKVWLLYEAAGEVDPPRPWSERLKEFRQHRAKQELFGEYGTLLCNALRAAGLHEAGLPAAPERLPAWLDELKESGLYVQWGGNRFTSPAANAPRPAVRPPAPIAVDHPRLPRGRPHRRGTAWRRSRMQPCERKVVEPERPPAISVGPGEQSGVEVVECLDCGTLWEEFDDGARVLVRHGRRPSVMPEPWTRP
jgi:AbiV family abortive infection protein